MLGLNELAIICGLCGALILLPLAIMLASNRRKKK
jgi:hypothetical protein